jgi:hypothetical protein
MSKKGKDLETTQNISTGDLSKFDLSQTIVLMRFSS